MRHDPHCRRAARPAFPRRLTLVAMLLLAGVPPGRAQEAILVAPLWTQADERRLEALLQKPLAADYHQEPLGRVTEDLNRKTGAQFQLDLKSLEDASIGPDTPVTCKFSPLPLERALELILRPVDLTWTVLDGHLAITTPDRANYALLLKVYPVHDLANRVGGVSGRGFSTRLENLSAAIQNNIAPTTWSDVGGPGAITEFSPSRSLLIAQTVEVHRQIDALLAALRRAREVQEDPRRHKHPAQPVRLRHTRTRSAEGEALGRYLLSPRATWSAAGGRD